MMNKKGFTLIELMVVVVIIGILAAVAVPKLFGMIAKSKASEVGPAAGTYVKMQQAYVSEAVAIGNWAIIGYKAPGTANATTNFTYSGFVTGGTDNTVALSGGQTDAWTAANNTKLNECDKGTNWDIDITAGTSGSAAGEAEFKSNTKCADLTPNFTTIGK